MARDHCLASELIRENIECIVLPPVRFDVMYSLFSNFYSLYAVFPCHSGAATALFQHMESDASSKNHDETDSQDDQSSTSQENSNAENCDSPKTSSDSIA